MSILVPVVSTGITLNEVPDKIAFYIELGECTQHCKGCHSSHLWKNVQTKTPLKTLVKMTDEAMDKGAQAIVLMGGTTNGIAKDTLINIINTLSFVAPVCLYSGSDDTDLNESIALGSHLKWIKTGSYKEALGGLRSPKTNQHFYRKEWEYRIKGDEVVGVIPFLVECTEVFQSNGTAE